MSDTYNSTTFREITDLKGLITKLPEDKIPEGNASDVANIDFSNTGMIQTKGGYDQYSNEISAVGNGLNGYLFKKNFGEFTNIKMRVRDDGSNTILEYHNPDNADTSTGKWEIIKSDLTTGAQMGFATANGNGGTQSNLVVMGNGVDNFMTWNGAVFTFASSTSNTIVCNETIENGVGSTGSVTINEVDYAYTGITDATFTGVTPDPTATAHVANDGVSQIVTEFVDNPKGNILLVSQRKLFLAGVVDNESKVYYTVSGDVTDFTITSGVASGGTFTLMDSGGGISFMEPKTKDTILVHKEDAIIAYTRGNDGTDVIEGFETIAEGSGAGATNLKAGTTYNGTTFFMTSVEGLKQISKSNDDASLNVNSITDLILPTIEEYDFSNSALAYFAPKKAIYCSCKDSEGVDKVITFYLHGSDEIGDISIDDEQVADWIVDEDELFFISTKDQNAYKFFERKSAQEIGRTHLWSSKAFTHNKPANGKEFNTLYVDGFIGERTKVKVTVLYGLLGSDGSKTKTIAWDDDFVKDNKISALGTTVLGVNSLGASSTGLQDSYPFSANIHLDPNINTRYKIKFETYYDDETSVESYWAISNIATNPILMGKIAGDNTNSND